MTQYRILPNSVRPELAADKITPINGDLPMSVALVFSPRATRHQHRAVGLLARRLGLAATPNDSPHAITLSGTTGAMQRAFNTTLKIHHRPDGRFRCRSGPVSVPQSWGSSVTAVLGLDTRPQLHPNFHRRMAGTNPMANTRWGFTAPYLAGIYGFPVHAGQGMSIGIVEFGGGYNAAWMQTYLNQCGIRRRPQVTINGKQHLGQQDNNVEVMLDVELAASLAPRARVVVYFRNNTTAGFYNAIAAAVAAGHDAVSVSWGAPESQWTGASMDAINALAQTAGANGTTIAAASGDSGSSDGTSGLAVDFPSSAPYILGCGD
jgi:kumamolisin